METLPDDVVVEILVRVTDVAALFRCAATHLSSLLSFFAVQQSREESTEGRSTAAPMPPFTPVPWCSLGERYSFLTCPWPPDSQAAVLTSRRDLLVVRFKTMILALYDPIAGKGRDLPELKSDRPFQIEGCALLTRADCCPDETRGAAASSFFKVLIIGGDRDEPRHSLHVFTSTEPSSSWTTPRECYDSIEDDDTHVVSRQTTAVVCHGGIAHWLFKNTSNLYGVCARTAEMSLTRLPVTLDQTQPLLGVTNDGTICLLRLDKKCTMLEIWTRPSDHMTGDCSNTRRWHRTKMIELQRPEHGKIDQAQCVCVGLWDNHEDVYIVDLQTGAMEAVTNWFRGIVVMAVPFEMDWPEFFTRHLANTRIERAKLGGVLSKIADPFWDQ
ncbi:hypothetical protein VPH35_016562 [Triticum aestivum]